MSEGVQLTKPEMGSGTNTDREEDSGRSTNCIFVSLFAYVSARRRLLRCGAAKKTDKEVKLNWLSIFEGDWSLFKCNFLSSVLGYLLLGDMCILFASHEGITVFDCLHSPYGRDTTNHDDRNPVAWKIRNKLLSCFPTLIWLNLSILMITSLEAAIKAGAGPG